MHPPSWFKSLAWRRRQTQELFWELSEVSNRRRRKRVAKNGSSVYGVKGRRREGHFWPAVLDCVLLLSCLAAERGEGLPRPPWFHPHRLAEPPPLFRIRHRAPECRRGCSTAFRVFRDCSESQNRLLPSAGGGGVSKFKVCLEPTAINGFFFAASHSW